MVVAGSALEGYGIRKCGDIDIAVTRKIYNELKNKKWKEVKKPSGLKVLQKNEFEIGINFHYGSYKTSTKKLIKTATIINEIPFVDLREMIAFKKAMNRDKDIVDIELIKQYLHSQT